MMMSIGALANRIRMMKEEGYRYIPVFGSGISIASDVPDSNSIKKEIMDIVLPESDPSKFDDVWKKLSESEQHAALSKFLKGKKPSQGYKHLLELVKADYFKLILTFNFDDLIERVFEEDGYADFETLVVGFDSETEIRRSLYKEDTKTKLLKLHGCLRRKRYYYSLSQILEFHPEVKSLFTDISSRELIICGYSFNDLDVLRAISLEGGSLYYVNIDEPNRIVTEILRKRNSENNCIVGEQGDFDVFFAKLAEALEITI